VACSGATRTIAAEETRLFRPVFVQSWKRQ